uniref:Uncharacterized protein n=1 Tax=Clytia hemisphaerica TaxID=252671 RepID=A0A7M5UPE5_9CNID
MPDRGTTNAAIPNTAVEFEMDELQALQESASFNDQLCIDVRYADDTTFIAPVFEKLQLSTNQLQEACLRYGMKIYARETLTFITTTSLILKVHLTQFREFGHQNRN